MQFQMNHLKLLLILMIASMLAACGSTNGMLKGILPAGSYLSWSSLTLVSDEDANSNSAIAVDVVMLHDEESLGLLQNLPASKWFATRDDLLKTFPKGLSFQTVELAPGQTLQMKQDMFLQKRQVGTLVFANYLTPGEHRVRVDQLKGQLMIQLSTKSFTVMTVQP